MSLGYDLEGILAYDSVCLGSDCGVFLTAEALDVVEKVLYCVRGVVDVGDTALGSLVLVDIHHKDVYRAGDRLIHIGVLCSESVVDTADLQQTGNGSAVGGGFPQTVSCTCGDLLDLLVGERSVACGGLDSCAERGSLLGDSRICGIHTCGSAVRPIVAVGGSLVECGLVNAVGASVIVVKRASLKLELYAVLLCVEPFDYDVGQTRRHYLCILRGDIVTEAIGVVLILHPLCVEILAQSLLAQKVGVAGLRRALLLVGILGFYSDHERYCIRRADTETHHHRRSCECIALYCSSTRERVVCGGVSAQAVVGTVEELLALGVAVQKVREVAEVAALSGVADIGAPLGMIIVSVASRLTELDPGTERGALLVGENGGTVVIGGYAESLEQTQTLSCGLDVGEIAVVVSRRIGVIECARCRIVKSCEPYVDLGAEKVLGHALQSRGGICADRHLCQIVSCLELALIVGDADDLCRGFSLLLRGGVIGAVASYVVQVHRHLLVFESVEGGGGVLGEKLAGGSIVAPDVRASCDALVVYVDVGSGIVVDNVAAIIKGDSPSGSVLNAKMEPFVEGNGRAEEIAVVVNVIVVDVDAFVNDLQLQSVHIALGVADTDLCDDGLAGGGLDVDVGVEHMPIVLRVRGLIKVEPYGVAVQGVGLIGEEYLVVGIHGVGHDHRMVLGKRSTGRLIYLVSSGVDGRVGYNVFAGIFVVLEVCTHTVVIDGLVGQGGIFVRGDGDLYRFVIIDLFSVDEPVAEGGVHGEAGSYGIGLTVVIYAATRTADDSDSGFHVEYSGIALGAGEGLTDLDGEAVLAHVDNISVRVEPVEDVYIFVFGSGGNGEAVTEGIKTAGHTVVERTARNLYLYIVTVSQCVLLVAKDELCRRAVGEDLVVELSLRRLVCEGLLVGSGGGIESRISVVDVLKDAVLRDVAVIYSAVVRLYVGSDVDGITYVLCGDAIGEEYQSVLHSCRRSHVGGTRGVYGTREVVERVVGLTLVPDDHSDVCGIEFSILAHEVVAVLESVSDVHIVSVLHVVSDDVEIGISAFVEIVAHAPTGSVGSAAHKRDA